MSRRHLASLALVALVAPGIDGVLAAAPGTISPIGDRTRLADIADLMTQQLHADRRVRSATYRVEAEVLIR